MKKCPKCNVELQLAAACEPWSDEHLICPRCDGTSPAFTTQKEDNEAWRIQSDRWRDRPKDPDGMQHVLTDVTKDLRSDGKLSAAMVAVAFGAGEEALGRLVLNHFVQVTRFRVAVRGPNFQQWAEYRAP